ncbi:hypothetical protein BH23GEM6_BH23GEM6_26860 [soil metagenome]
MESDRTLAEVEQADRWMRHDVEEPALTSAVKVVRSDPLRNRTRSSMGCIFSNA